MTYTARAIRMTVLALVLTAAALTVAKCEGSGSHPFTTRAATAPVILVVTRHQAIGLMQHGDWCTRLRPGVFACTPASPFCPTPAGRLPAAQLITHPV